MTVLSLSRLHRQDQVALQLAVLGLALVAASALLLSAAGIRALPSFAFTRRRCGI